MAQPNPETVRELLNRDRPWSAYALGDLDPRRAHFCRWFIHGETIVLLYREFETPILFASGPDPDVLDLVDHSGPCYLQIPQHFHEAVDARYKLDWTRPMRRMSLTSASDFAEPAAAIATPLTPDDEAAVRELYSDGVARHEDPDFFMRSQMNDATFYGVWSQGRLLAAGGTHLYSDAESSAAIGNVYTHSEHRGKGYGKAVTAAITANLAGRGISTIALNVKNQNAAAIRVYEQLGFRFHCGYWEGFATMKKI